MLPRAIVFIFEFSKLFVAGHSLRLRLHGQCEFVKLERLAAVLRLYAVVLPTGSFRRISALP